MQTGYSRTTNQALLRFMKRALLLLLFLCLVPVASARDDSPAFSSVVLVLKLVSTTHVRPTTGIVIAENGLVLVPADFASAEGEIIVLDGGADILSNGRPATVVNPSIPGGLAILSVKGLSRPGVTVSQSAFSQEAELHLAAFPPAEYIAKGAEPLWTPVKLILDGSNRPVSISAETPLPYVTGAIVDNCGYLAGLGLAKGAQSMETGKAPDALFVDELSGILASVQVILPTATCKNPQLSSEDPANPAHPDHVNGETSDAEDQAKDLPLEPETAGASASETLEPVAQTPSSHSQQGNTSKMDNAAKSITRTDPPSLWRSVPLWLPLLVLLALGALIWKVVFFLRSGKSDGRQPSNTTSGPGIQSASDEPDTEQLEPGSESSAVKPRSAPSLELTTLDLSARPDGCNGVFVIEGHLDSDTDFKRFCFVNTDKINIVIGRGEADITIEHTAISRNHARIESHGELMTVSDLGSKNGTFIGDIPCLQGEIMFIGAEDQISLGDVQFKSSVVKQEAEWA